VVLFKEGTEGGEKGYDSIMQRPFEPHGEGWGGESGVGVHVEEGEGRRGGLAWRRAAQGSQQWPLAIERGRRCVVRTREPGGPTDGPRP
jgi:hypothetical protein